MKEQRPIIPNAVVNDNMSLEEQFQNSVIRSIIKDQHRTLILTLAAYLHKQKINFAQLDESQRKNYLISSISKDLAFKSTLRGMILGNLSTDEYSTYLSLNSSEIDKRIINILIERFQTNLDEIASINTHI